MGEAGEPAVITAVRGVWRVDAEVLGLGFEGRPALLSPLDRPVFDRKRMRELLEFHHQLEMCKPAAHRRWAYYALPLLHGDRLVGKLEATLDRAHAVLRVDAVHEDVPFSRSVAAAVDRGIEALADWLGVELDRPS